MSTTPHPSTDVLLQFATGETGLETGVAEIETHMNACAPCRQQVEKLEAFFNTVRDELLETRPECPSSDQLARLPPGAEHDDPHLQQCPLCRQEVRMLFEVESAARLGTEVGEVPASGLFYRPSPVVQGGGFAYQRGMSPVEWVIAEGEGKELVVAGTTVGVRCVGGELIVDVAETGAELALALSNELLEKQIPLSVGEQRLPAGGWERVRVIAS
jgi:hypothetical protein